MMMALQGPLLAGRGTLCQPSAVPPLPPQMLFALILAVAVFFLVPRGVSVGRIEVHSEFVSWNKTMRTFQLGLEAELPIFNPNYLQVRCCMRPRVRKSTTCAHSTLRLTAIPHPPH